MGCSVVFFLLYIFFRERKGGERNISGEKESLISCLLHADLGIESTCPDWESDCDLLVHEVNH